ncbi:MAG: NAD-dependent epimerase/dehydratase family protein [Myxococcota bacterium]
MTADRNRKVLILGCGFLGQVVAQRLAFRGVPVAGTTRSVEQSGVIRTRGAESVMFDGHDLAPVVRAASHARGVVMCIPPDAEASLDRRLVDALAELPIEAAVYISSTSVYGDKDGQRTVESDAVAPDSPKGRARVLAEDVWRGARFPTAVLRPAGIYGPGRSLLHRMAAGKYRLVDGGRAVTNRIHVADLASLVVRALERPEAGATWLGSDLAPAPQAGWWPGSASSPAGRRRPRCRSPRRACASTRTRSACSSSRSASTRRRRWRRSA